MKLFLLQLPSCQIKLQYCFGTKSHLVASELVPEVTVIVQKRRIALLLPSFYLSCVNKWKKNSSFSFLQVLLCYHQIVGYHEKSMYGTGAAHGRKSFSTEAKLHGNGFAVLSLVHTRLWGVGLLLFIRFAGLRRLALCNTGKEFCLHHVHSWC